MPYRGARFYEGKRVMVTGGLGFIGSNLAMRLVDLGSKVLLVDSLVAETGANRFNIAPIEDRVSTRLVDVRDAYTGSHSYVVGELAARVAKRMSLEVEQIELLRLAGSLHDLGKLAIPEEILRKPGPLTGAERLVLERHPQIGHRMLDSLGVDPVANWVRHHHERWDGTGYPNRLAGDTIPLGARILFVADAYDAMTTDRVYRGRLPHFRAIAELERCAGTQFDPDVVAAFRREFSVVDAPEAEIEAALAETA